MMPSGHPRTSRWVSTSSWRSFAKAAMIRSRCLMVPRKFSDSLDNFAICSLFCFDTFSIFLCITSCRSNSISISLRCALSSFIIWSFGLSERATSRRRKSSTRLNLLRVFTLTLKRPISSSLSRNAISRPRRSSLRLLTVCVKSWRFFSKPALTACASACSVTAPSRSFSMMSRLRTCVSCSFFKVNSTRRFCSRSFWLFLFNSATSKSCSIPSWSSIVSKRCFAKSTKSLSFNSSWSFSVILLLNSTCCCWRCNSRRR
mmetsp:Transcript_88559/g.249547  ORF Transcript_88559/g.249547 Transcript_88559/m.249547 type:complete len:259 (+) Transcript_88559:922-1698(+)